MATLSTKRSSPAAIDRVAHGQNLVAPVSVVSFGLSQQTHKAKQADTRRFCCEKIPDLLFFVDPEPTMQGYVYRAFVKVLSSGCLTKYIMGSCPQGSETPMVYLKPEILAQKQKSPESTATNLTSNIEWAFCFALGFTDLLRPKSYLVSRNMQLKNETSAQGSE